MSLSFYSPPGSPRLPRALLGRLKNAVLGKDYALSIAFVAPREMRRLNRRYRGRDSATDILSFPLARTHGEILFCMREVKRAAPKFHATPPRFLPYLLIHGMLHLKGLTHGRRMERLERQFCKRFFI